jgi:hypothetical protein
MGAIRRKIEINRDTSDAISIFSKILSELGQVKQIDKDQLKIKGKMTFGLQSVPIKINCTRISEGKTIIEILAWSDDIWSYAAKDCISRLLKFYNDPTKEIEQKDLIGMRPIYLAIIVTAFYWILKYLIFPTLGKFDLWEYTAVFGVVVIVYFVISRIRFNYL